MGSMPRLRVRRLFGNNRSRLAQWSVFHPSISFLLHEGKLSSTSCPCRVSNSSSGVASWLPSIASALNIKAPRQRSY